MSLIAVPDKEATTAAQNLIHNWILWYGIPEQVHTDFGIKRISQSVHGQSNGAIIFYEDLNDTITADLGWPY